MASLTIHDLFVGHAFGWAETSRHVRFDLTDDLVSPASLAKLPQVRTQYTENVPSTDRALINLVTSSQDGCSLLIDQLSSKSIDDGPHSHNSSASFYGLRDFA